MPLDMSCLSEDSISQLAALFEPAELEQIKDKKDKILSRLFSQRIVLLFAQADASPP